jgi:hypothetical protein
MQEVYCSYSWQTTPGISKLVVRYNRPENDNIKKTRHRPTTVKTVLIAFCTQPAKVVVQRAMGAPVKKSATHGLQTMRSTFNTYPLSRILAVVCISLSFKQNKQFIAEITPP